MKDNFMDITNPLLEWYRNNHRDLKWRKTREPFYIWISEIMLQQTRVEAVKGYYDRFLAEIPDIRTLALVSEEKLLKLWEGLGYYNRARNLQKAAKVIVEEFDGHFPESYDEVIKLPGIGEYTAGAICSICFDLPTPAIDGNVLRVVMRLLNCYDNIDDLKIKRKVREMLLPLYENGNQGTLTQAFMELGALICVPNGAPKCMECPLRHLCEACKLDTYSLLPVRKEKKKRRIEEKTVFILHDGDKYGIRKRGSKGLLANLWEFYHTDTKLNASDAVKFISEEGFQPVRIEKEIPYTHIFSHVEWRMTAYYIECRHRSENLLWIDKKEFETTYALPTAFRVFVEKES